MCTGKLNQNGVLRHSLLSFIEVIKNTKCDFFSNAKTKKEPKEDHIHIFQATFQCLIVTVYSSWFLDLQFLNENQLEEEMLSMLAQGETDDNAILCIVKNRFLEAKKDLLSTEMIVLFHKLHSFPRCHVPDPTVPNRMCISVLCE